MFCGKCGVKNPDDSKFCSECGAPLTDHHVKTPSLMSNSNTKNRLIGIIAVAIVVVVIAIIMFSLLGGRSYKTTIDQYINAQFDVDAEELMVLIPNEMLNYILEEGYDDNALDEFIDDTNDELQNMLDLIERYFEKDYEVSYHISRVKNVTGDDFDDLKDDYKDLNVEISAAKTIDIVLTISNSKTDGLNNTVVSVVKIGRSWYLDLISMGIEKIY